MDRLTVLLLVANSRYGRWGFTSDSHLRLCAKMVAGGEGTMLVRLHLGPVTSCSSSTMVPGFAVQRRAVQER
jgi:hypothetical protein